jgi:hypothetical protein
LLPYSDRQFQKVEDGMSDFEVHPIGTAAEIERLTARNAELEAVREALRDCGKIIAVQNTWAVFALAKAIQNLSENKQEI